MVDFGQVLLYVYLYYMCAGMVDPIHHQAGHSLVKQAIQCLYNIRE